MDAQPGRAAESGGGSGRVERARGKRRDRFLAGAGEQQVAGGRAENNWGAYGEDMISITRRTLLTLSGRVDRWLNFRAFSAKLPFSGAGGTVTPFPGRSESFFSPRLAVLQRVTSKV